jgi:hypothetical protein
LLEKNKQINFKKKLSVVILLMFGFFVVSIFSLKDFKKDNLLLSIKNGIPVLEQEQISLFTNDINRPVRIKIPSINVDALIESVGFTSDGSVDVPKGPTNTAWFNKWPRPGEDGNSIITGHSG